jgi:glycine dehydrogenase subunit 2
MGMFTRALAYIMSHGADGLRQVAEDAVLNANYVLRRLDDLLDAPFGASGPCMHEALFSDKGFAGGLTTLDLAKGLIDEGFHPMTMYFPLVVHGAMLIEPTETESKAALDQFIGAMRSVAERAKAGDQSLKAAPVHAPRRRLDETLAARKPVLAIGEPDQAEARNELQPPAHARPCRRDSGLSERAFEIAFLAPRSPGVLDDRLSRTGPTGSGRGGPPVQGDGRDRP